MQFSTCFTYADLFTTLETRKIQLGRVNFHFWNHHRGYISQLLANIFYSSPVTVPKVLMKVNSAYFFLLISEVANLPSEQVMQQMA